MATCYAGSNARAQAKAVFVLLGLRTYGHEIPPANMQRLSNSEFCLDRTSVPTFTRLHSVEHGLHGADNISNTIIPEHLNLVNRVSVTAPSTYGIF
jgi:hypothetical protein